MFDVTKRAPMLGQVKLIGISLGQIPISYNINARSPGVINYGYPGGTFVNPGYGAIPNAYGGAPAPAAPAEAGTTEENEIRCFHCNKPSEFKKLTRGQAKAWSDPTGLDRGCEEVSSRECDPYASSEQQAFNPYGGVMNYGAVPSMPLMSFGGESFGGGFSSYAGSSFMGRIPLVPGMGRTALR